MGLRTFVFICLALVLAPVGALPAAAQEATPAAGTRQPTDIEMPETRIVSLSPDGTRVAAGIAADNRPRLLCVYDVATLTEQACGDLDSHQISIWLDSVVWSPDSTKLAFSEDAFRTLNDGDLWTMDAATGEITNLTDDGSEGKMPVLGDDEVPSDTPIHVDILPAWAPDGRSIAFSRSPIIGGEFRGNQIVSVDLASGEVETLAPVTLDEPGVVFWGLTWAPDGRQLFYSVAHPDTDNQQNGVWAYDPATGQSRHILKNDPEQGPPVLLRVAATGLTGLLFYPVVMRQFAADGDYYALIDLETSARFPVNPVAPDPSSPAIVRVATFSPDGTRVLYGLHRFQDDMTRYLVRDLPGGPPDLVAETGGPPIMTTLGGGLFWANDGTVFAATDVNAGLLLHLDPGEIPTIPAVEPAGSPEAEPVASPAATGAFAPGAMVTLTVEAPLRATPSANGTVVLERRPGAELTIVGEPVEAGGETWVPVVEPATGTIGYVEASLLES